MSTYAIGDIQGCFDSLQGLLAQIGFEPRVDRLWLVGDLVNRGPKSLEVLRWAVAHRESIVAVLGNHDLHLLARAAGLTDRRPRDTLDAVLEAPDRDQLLSWVRCRPLLHQQDGFLLVHAGLLPLWDLRRATSLAAEIAETLRSDDWADLLVRWRQRGGAARWDLSLTPEQRQVHGLRVLTGIRLCRPDGQADFGYKGPPASAPTGLVPWFERWRAPELTLVFGHWAALGCHIRHGLLGIDSGCVWGRSLTAVRLDDGARFEQRALEGQAYLGARSA